MSGNPRIVADGPLRARLSGRHGELRARLLCEARLRHAAALEEAPPWRRLWLRIVIEREVRAQLRKAFPPHALYAATRPADPEAPRREP
jgi:hypothetical protein